MPTVCGRSRAVLERRCRPCSRPARTSSRRAGCATASEATSVCSSSDLPEPVVPATSAVRAVLAHVDGERPVEALADRRGRGPPVGPPALRRSRPAAGGSRPEHVQQPRGVGQRAVVLVAADVADRRDRPGHPLAPAGARRGRRARRSTRRRRPLHGAPAAAARLGGRRPPGTPRAAAARRRPGRSRRCRTAGPSCSTTACPAWTAAAGRRPARPGRPAPGRGPARGSGTIDRRLPLLHHPGQLADPAGRGRRRRCRSARRSLPAVRTGVRQPAGPLPLAAGRRRRSAR